jgi:acetate kinase
LLDTEANATGGPRITVPESKVAAWVIPTNEEAMIARHTARLLGFQGAVNAL